MILDEFLGKMLAYERDIAASEKDRNCPVGYTCALLKRRAGEIDRSRDRVLVELVKVVVAMQKPTPDSQERG